MIVYVVYQNASDIEKMFCVRRWEIKARYEEIPREIVLESDDYNEIYDYMINKDLTKIERQEQDDPVIKELWL
jgi:hypothetical protein